MNSRDVQHQQQQQLTYLAARGGVPTRCDPHLSPLLLPFCGICSTSGLQAPRQAGLIAMISLTSRKCDTSFVASVSSLHLSFLACVWTLWVCVCERECVGLCALVNVILIAVRYCSPEDNYTFVQTEQTCDRFPRSHSSQLWPLQLWPLRSVLASL